MIRKKKNKQERQRHENKNYSKLFPINYKNQQTGISGLS